jgi:Amt family ammonium transporter
MIDFAGSGVVHMTGGYTALIAAKILGARRGRFEDADGNPLAEPASFPAHSVALQVLGTFILWFGWYGFNPGSALYISTAGYDDVAGLCAVTTTLAAAAGAISALVTDTTFGYFKTGEAEYDLTYAMNGCLSGLVAVTAGTSVFTPWAAFVVGLVGGVVYCGFSALLLKLKIDDAVDATPVHFANGAWGCLAVGLLADPDRTSITYGSDLHGLFYSGNGNLLLVEFCGVLWIIGWVSITMIPFFLVLNFLGLFRVDALEEEVGLDISHHKGAAYDLAGPSKEDVEELVARRSTAHGKVAAPDA